MRSTKVMDFLNVGTWILHWKSRKSEAEYNWESEIPPIKSRKKHVSCKNLAILLLQLKMQEFKTDIITACQ